MPTCGDYTMRAQPRRRAADDKEEPVFLRKTYEMICSCHAGAADDRTGDKLACWSETGETFIVKDCDVFARDVIPNFFKHSKFSSFVRQLNFYGFRKVKSSISAEGTDSKWWEFKHELFHRDKPQLLSSMKRATHYGAAVDTKEVDDLRSEVSRLRDHIDDMGDKIGQLTSLVEALAVSGSAPKPEIEIAAAGAAAGREAALAGCTPEHTAHGWGPNKSGGLAHVALGHEHLSFAAKNTHDDEDSKLFPPAIPSGAGDIDPAGFLPSSLMSRKRKLMGASASRGDAPEDHVSGLVAWGSAASPPPGAIIKQEMITGHPTVKQEPAKDASGRDTGPALWPVHARIPLEYAGLRPVSNDSDGVAPGQVAASSCDALFASESRKSVAGPTALSSTDSTQPLGDAGSEFIQGFADQFLSFESPTGSYVFADRDGRVGAELVAPSVSDRGQVDCVPQPGMHEESRDCAEMTGAGKDDSDGNTDEEENIDIGGDGVPMAAVSQALGLAAIVTTNPEAVPAEAPPSLTTHGHGRVPADAREEPIQRTQTSVPMVIQSPQEEPYHGDAREAEECTQRAMSPIPAPMDELQDNLESLPADSRTKLKEGLSALMQHPTFLAALVGQRSSTPAALSRAERSPAPVPDTDATASSATAAGAPEEILAPTRVVPPRVSSPRRMESDNSSGSKSAGGAYCSDRGQNQGDFGQHMPRSEEACA